MNRNNCVKLKCKSNSEQEILISGKELENIKKIPSYECFNFTGFC